MHLLVLGGNSDIGAAIGAVFARRRGALVTLASRNLEQLEKRARDIALRHQVETRAVAFDALDYVGHEAFYAALDPKPDVVVAAFGLLGDQDAAQRDFALARAVMETNYVGAVSILEIVARDLERRGRGAIIGLSSVAGVRGRKANYIYGSAKGGLLIYLSGLRNRLFGAGVHVLTVLPGFVASKMTEHLDLPPGLTASPESVAEAVFRAWERRRNVIYVTWKWRLVMAVIRSLPEFLFKRTSI